MHIRAGAGVLVTSQSVIPKKASTLFQFARHLRSLVVDLTPPRFTPLPGGSGFGPEMFKPENMPLGRFKDCVKFLRIYTTKGFTRSSFALQPSSAGSAGSEGSGSGPGGGGTGGSTSNNGNNGNNGFNGAGISTGTSAGAASTYFQGEELVRVENGAIHIKGGLTVYPGCNPIELYQEYVKLNEGQKDAVKKVLATNDYTLLLGLPGTGKTSTLSLIVR